jgi:Carbohydrate/starch-binding module (family 21)
MSIDPHASLRQSPPPLNNAIIPSGAVISPPESTGNSSDEEVSPTDVRQVDLIDAALRSLEARRKTVDGLSQENNNTTQTQGSHENKGAVAVPALTPEARKISHSRSTSTESSLTLFPDSEENSSVESEHEQDGELGAKPPMVRKKSGELVRPALRSKRRPSSMPGTPIYSKNVHFDAHLEHIRHFLQLDKPLAVSANTSPVETYSEELEYPFGSKKAPGIEWQIKLPNFPSNAPARKQQPVRLERMFLSADQKNLVGVVSVANLAFHKKVVARFTVDYWKTVSEVTAEYNHDIRRKQAHDGFDRFDFNVKLSDITDLDKKTLFVCIRYSVEGQEYWDNNDSMNYQVEFSKMEKTPNREKAQQQIPSTRDHGRALPRSRNNPSIAARPRSMPPAHFEDFRPSGPNFPASLDGSGQHADTDFHLSAVDSHDWLLEAPKPRGKPDPQAFGARYDFGLSLSAARSSGATEDRTTLSAKAKSLSSRAETPTTVHAHFLPRSDSTFQPSAIVSSKPHLESPVYKELVDKYCFVSSLCVEL